MAIAAIAQRRSIDVIFSKEFASVHFLGGRRLPSHVENVLTRADELRGIRVTIEAPFHVERLLFGDEWHFVNPPVAGRAADALSDVDIVVKVDEIGQAVNADPVQRAVVAKTRGDRSEHRLPLEQLRMAGHAGRGWR